MTILYIKYKIMTEHENHDYPTCAICHYRVKKRSQGKVLNCTANHEFHQKCIWKWIFRSNTCPLCRETVSKYPSPGCEFNEYIHFLNSYKCNIRKS